jgi:hypothetical protein
MMTQAPVKLYASGVFFSMLKFLKGRQTLYCQKILLPGVTGTVGIEQTHKAIFDRRIEVVGKERFTMF